jgi:uncharacterized protein (TIGR02391 family)
MPARNYSAAVGRPSLPPQRAIELLRERHADCDRIRALPRSDPGIQKWVNTTEAILDAAFGKPDGQPHQMTARFTHAGSFPIQRAGFSGRGGTPEHVLQRYHQSRTDQRKAVLESCIEQLEILAPPAALEAGFPPRGTATIHPQIWAKCGELYEAGHLAEAVEKSFKVVRDRLRELTGYEKGSEAFGKGKLHIRGAVAAHVDSDFNEGAKFLLMAIDMFRNEKSHTSDARITDPARAQQYLALSSLAMSLLDGGEIHTT